MAGLNKYQAYPEYRDSGVEWLGEVPSHWRVSKPRYMFNFGKGLTITKENLQDDGIPCINYGEIHSKYGFEVSPKIHPLKCVDEKYLKDNSGSLLLKGDIIFADTSEDIDGSGNFSQLISDNIVFAGYHTIIAKPLNRKNWRFYAYLLDCKELRTQVRHAVKGVKVFSITQAILRGLSVWLPTDDEQSKIADFLDHETAKIDNLIEKQQQLIELLKEKRQAVISHAVTKGLNPDVPMKDSGVEWLGKIPAHWTLTQIKYGYIITLGKMLQKNRLSKSEKLKPYLKAQNIQPTGIDLTNMDHMWFSPEEIIKLRLVCNDVLVSEGGDVGRSAIWQDEIEECYIQNAINRVRPFNKNSSIFLHYWLTFLKESDFISTLCNKATIAHYTVEKLASSPLLLPNEDQQTHIGQILNQKTKQFDILIEKQLHQIDLLKERRTALISAAVTGKIDLRNWTAPIPEAETPTEASA